MQTTVQRENVKHLLTCDGRHSGCVLDGFRLVRRVRGSKHLLRKPPAWSFERNILEQAHEHGVKVVEVHDLESNTTYTAPLALLWQRGIRLERGHGEQIALPLNLWHVENPAQGRLF